MQSTDAQRVIRRDAAFAVAFVAIAVGCTRRLGATGFDRLLLGGYVPSKTSMVFRTAEVLTDLGSPVAVATLGVMAAVLVWVRHRSLSWAVACIAAPGVAGVVEATLKAAIGRPRPSTAALTGEGGNGFPSGHAAGFAALVFVVAFLLAERRPVRMKSNGLFVTAGCAAVVMAVTRVVVGAHYPTDVVAGVLVGVVAADLVALTARQRTL